MGWCPCPTSQGYRIAHDVVPSLDGVADVAVITDLVAHRGHQGERSCLCSYRGLVPQIHG
jgi:hypothetical protein